jgi:hypothetical protein
MPKNLSHLLKNQQTPIDDFVQLAEELSGYPSEDVRLMSELAAGTRPILTQLNLDPGDTTAGELYHALLIEYEKTSNNFSRQIGEKTTDSTAQRLKRVVKVVIQGQTNRQIWALKKTVAKQLLKTHQPKKLMALLHYRSLDSMLKRESVGLIYAALSYTESPRWLKLMHKSLSSLSSKDFEAREAEFIVAPTGHWSVIAAKTGPISKSSELGVVIFWPNSKADQTASLGLSALGLQAADELRCNSAWLKLHQFNHNLGKLISDNFAGGLSPRLKIAGGHTVTWRAIQRAFAGRPDADFSENFEPHLERSDLNRQTPSQILSELAPQLYFWANCESVLFCDVDGQVVSCNLADTAVNYASKKNLNKHSRSFARQGLEDELVSRYLSHQGFERYILGSIDNSVSGQSSSYVGTINFSKFGTLPANQARLV